MRFRQAVAIVVLVVYMPSCIEYHTVGVEPARLPKGKEIRVTLKDSTQVFLRKARIEGDSIIGDTRFDGPGGKKGREAVAVGDIARVETQGVSAAGVLLGAGIVFGLFALATPKPHYSSSGGSCNIDTSGWTNWDRVRFRSEP